MFDFVSVWFWFIFLISSINLFRFSIDLKNVVRKLYFVAHKIKWTNNRTHTPCSKESRFYSPVYYCVFWCVCVCLVMCWLIISTEFANFVSVFLSLLFSFYLMRCAAESLTNKNRPNKIDRLFVWISPARCQSQCFYVLFLFRTVPGLINMAIDWEWQ